VRLRLFLADGREIVAEQPFHLVSEEMARPHSASADRVPVALPKSGGAARGKVLEHAPAS
jgi:hypothetical protein